MNPTVFTALRARCETIEHRWLELLEAQNARLPRARPLGLGFWIPKAVQRVFGYLEHAEPIDGVGSLREHGCGCGTNPYLAFYSAGEQALLESLERVLASCPGDGEEEHRRRVYCALSRLALRDIEQFCRVCENSAHCEHRQARRETYGLLARADVPASVGGAG